MGIDVEKMNFIEISDFKASFSNSEWEAINNAQFPVEQFYWYWTRKESIIKAIGEDLSYLNLLEIDPSKNYFMAKGKKWYLKSLDFGKGYEGALCSEYPIHEYNCIKSFAPEWL
jgi:4'-phosphopantetheinyl transferase